MNNIKEKTKLEVLNEDKLLPTGKYHISFSEVSDWISCAFKHKLKHVQKIEIPEESEHLIYGSVIHDAIEDYLNGGELNAENTASILRPQLMALEKFKTQENIVDEFCESLKPIFNELPNFLKTNLSNFEIVEAEHQLQESLEAKPGRYFKGFIDAIFKIKKLNKITGEEEIEYIVADWKSSTKAWDNSKKKDLDKQMQMILYKYFWCRKMNIDESIVKCAWVVLKRNAKENEHIDIIYVPSEKEDIERSLKRVSQMITTLDKGIFLKNRNSCRFCPYANTEHCT